MFIPASVKMICSCAFEDCTRLAGLQFAQDSKLTTIQLAAFRHSGVENFTAPQTLREIGLEAFADCDKLKSVVLNEGLQCVGPESVLANYVSCKGVFENSSIRSVQLPHSTKLIQKNTFRNCKNLTQVALPLNVEILGDCCFQNSRLETVMFRPVEDDQMDVDQSMALYDRPFQESSRLRVIGAFAFQNTCLRNFVFPRSVR